MNLQTGVPVFIAVAAVVVLGTLATALGVLPAGSVTTTSRPTSAYVTSPDGLRLTLQISNSAVSRGGSLTINVTETNTNPDPLNESASRNWPVEGLRMSACYASVYPFGVAVYHGHFSKGNLPSSARLNLFPLVPCPLLIRYISGYYFHPNSDLAVVLPGTASAMPMASGVRASGNYTGGGSLTPFAPGEYTVAAGDGWGSLVLLYFVVN